MPDGAGDHPHPNSTDVPHAPRRHVTARHDAVILRQRADEGPVVLLIGSVVRSRESHTWWPERKREYICVQKPNQMLYCLLILWGRWMLESDWLTNVLRCAIIFRETHGERSSRHRITWPYHSAKWFLLLQRSYNKKITKTHNDTSQTNKYSKQKDKIDRSCPCFCHKIKFYCVRKAHSLLSLGLSLTDTI